MALQRMTVATIAGEAGRRVAGLFRKWHSIQAAGGQGTLRCVVDEFAEQLRDRGGIPPVVYFCEWFDYWSMGDLIHFGNAVEGKQFEIRYGSRRESMSWIERCADQFPEQQWLAMRLREASEAWQSLAEAATIVILRQVLGPSHTDEEVMDSLSDASLFADKWTDIDG